MHITFLIPISLSNHGTCLPPPSAMLWLKLTRSFLPTCTIQTSLWQGCPSSLPSSTPHLPPPSCCYRNSAVPFLVCHHGGGGFGLLLEQHVGLIGCVVSIVHVISRFIDLASPPPLVMLWPTPVRLSAPPEPWQPSIWRRRRKRKRIQVLGGSRARFLQRRGTTTCVGASIHVSSNPSCESGYAYDRPYLQP